MPHIMLEYSDNIIDHVQPLDFFKTLHTQLATIHSISMLYIKSHAHVYRDFYIADGAQTHAFVALQISMLSGRDPQDYQQVLAIGEAVINQYFPRSMAQPGCQTNVEIRLIERDLYIKKIST